MKIFFDTEFIEDGKTIDLISIGMVDAGGYTFYREARACDLSRASPWVRQNVIPHLKPKFIRSRSVIAQEIREFVGEKPEFWAYYADYDWVALCQLYGTMLDLPEGWPKYCRDVKQWCDSLGNPKLPEKDGAEHDALNDALWTKRAWEFLKARSIYG